MARELMLDSVRSEVRAKLEPYLKELVELYGEDIVSVALYGSATGKDYSPENSDINLLVILREVDFNTLKKALKPVSRGISRKIAAPLILTPEHIEGSRDIFPIEFLEMKENHIPLCGEDVIGRVEIDPAHLLLFCREQIKGKLIRIRQAYLEIGLRRAGVESLLKESLYGLMPLFRNLLRLRGKQPPVDKEEILTLLSEEFKLDKDVLIAILRDKRDDEKIAGVDVEIYFEKYLNQIRQLAGAVEES